MRLHRPVSSSCVDAVAQLLLRVDHLGHVGERAHRSGRPRLPRPAAGRQLSESQRSSSSVTSADQHVLHRLVAGQRRAATGWSAGDRVRRSAPTTPSGPVMQSTSGAPISDRRAARMRSRGRVGVDDDPVRVGNDDALVDRVDDRAVELLDRAPFVLGAAALGGVGAHDDRTGLDPGFVEDVRHGRPHRHEPLVVARDGPTRRRASPSRRSRRAARRDRAAASRPRPRSRRRRSPRPRGSSSRPGRGCRCR